MTGGLRLQDTVHQPVKSRTRQKLPQTRGAWGPVTTKRGSLDAALGQKKDIRRRIGKICISLECSES